MVEKKDPLLVKLDEIECRYSELESKIADPEIASDAELRDVPVIMLTSIVGSEYAGHFPTDGPLHAHMFLDKPVPMDKILEVANQYTRQISASNQEGM